MPEPSQPSTDPATEVSATHGVDSIGIGPTVGATHGADLTVKKTKVLVSKEAPLKDAPPAVAPKKVRKLKDEVGLVAVAAAKARANEATQQAEKSQRQEMKAQG
ncbi:hypothetical protein B296_00023616 [Ensete ventricosum]|uniref:Uncharacterized protein n=1 Tax=Ensete ventricosum TaxID=4639 RepID=A0A427ARG1_ENSVE|nr:hypothetical protein B296_00023616 [Ensete ventricosum]